MITEYYTDDRTAEIYMKMAKKHGFIYPYKIVAALLFIEADTENLDALKIIEEILPNMVTIKDRYLTRSFQVLTSKEANFVVSNHIDQLKEELEDSMVIEPASLKPYVIVDWARYFGEVEMEDVFDGTYHMVIDGKDFYLTPLD